ncbi:SprB repeat-containing protein [Lacinutrix neustonica]|uniref:SprB repeat-containing protein n=1 Tax=Lacinutrix neustonica TaxID=2980107 RepID=A0A9E8MXR7_9FLAO|nr:SprB repeat-containing protein [Lacinutrix neustonica]WAC02219.1 SprB repeat-containing protein [Lacinutrix neustonica]
MLPNGAPQVPNIFTITAPGTYYFQVNDLDTGCTFATAPFTVAPFDNTDVVATATTPVTCFGDTNGVLEINVSGYTGNYTYEVFDDSGASVGGVVAANTATNPQVITGLSGGNYTVEVVETDSPFCTTTTNTVTIGSPASPLNVVATETSNVTCTNNQGTINAVASGGWGSYEYELTGTATVAYSTNGIFTDLAAGSYTVNVRDASGCIASDTVILTAPTPITAPDPMNTTLSCFGDQNGVITVSGVSGGQGGNYTYILNTTSPVPSASGPQSSPVFGGLGAGTYSVSVTDGYNCIWTSSPIDIFQPTPVDANLIMDTRQTCSTPTATLVLDANGGTGPYTYSDDITFTTASAPFASSVTISVPVGTYSYYIQDANGCISSVSNDIIIEPIPALTVDLSESSTVIGCFGDDTGIIEATAQGGLGNYVYTLEDTMGNTIAATQSSPGVFTGLFSGDYVVYVSGAGNCEVREPITITQEPTAALVATPNTQNITCAGSNNGFFEITSVTGGTGIIKYAISPQLNQFFDIGVVQNDLSAGYYEVYVIDANGCSFFLDFTISEPAILAPVIDESSVQEVDCNGDADGAFTLNITGGTLPYSWSLDDYNAPVYTQGTATQTQVVFANLSSGVHTVYIRDAQGCEAEVSRTFNSVTINPKPLSIIIATIMHPVIPLRLLSMIVLQTQD